MATNINLKELKAILFTFGFCVLCMSACSVFSDEDNEVELKKLELEIVKAENGIASTKHDSVVAHEYKKILKELERIKTPIVKEERIFVKATAEDIKSSERQENRTFWYVRFETEDHEIGQKMVVINEPVFDLKKIQQAIKPNYKKYVGITYFKEMTYQEFYHNVWKKEEEKKKSKKKAVVEEDDCKEENNKKKVNGVLNTEKSQKK